MGNILSRYQNQYHKIASLCKGFIHQELLSKGQGSTIPLEKIFLEKMEEDDEAFHLIKDGILEHPTGRANQLLGVLVLSGHNTDNPTERVDNLLVGWHRTFTVHARLGIRDGNNWIYKSKEIPRPQL